MIKILVGTMALYADRDDLSSVDHLAVRFRSFNFTSFQIWIGMRFEKSHPFDVQCMHCLAGEYKKNIKTMEIRDLISIFDSDMGSRYLVT